MNFPTEPTPDQQAAARLTAWALGELTAETLTEFENLLQADADMETKAGGTREFCQMLERSLAPPAETGSLTLSPAARQQLELAASHPVKSKVSLWMPTLAAAACFAVMGTVFHKTRRAPAKAGDVSGPGAPRLVYSNEEKLLMRMGLGYYDLGQFKEAGEKFNQVLALNPGNSAARRQLERTEYEVNNYYRAARDHTRIKMLNDVDSLWVTPGLEEVSKDSPGAPERKSPQLASSIVEQEIILRQKRSWPPLRDLSPRSRNVLDRNSGFSADSPLAEVDDFTPGHSEAEPENPFRPVAEAPLSTFSIDVDTASYAIARRYLNEGERPPKASVRLEEMINYFPMDDAPPVDGKPFAVHVETASAPWAPEHRLVRIALKGKALPDTGRRPAHLVFLVDTSGSMGRPNKLPLVQQSLRLLLDQLAPQDHVTLVTYAGASELKLPATPVVDRARIAAAIDALTSGGSTNGSGGIMAAYQQARAHFQEGGVNRVILATDGDFNVGLTGAEDLETLIAREAKSGVYLSVLAYGSDNLKDQTAELLADKGNGNYAYIDSLGEARRALVSQLQGTLVTIAKDVKIQVEFNPAQVASYRLLGYENRALADKDFNDDKKDAGEIGAGHSVTALYEIVPAGHTAPSAVAVDILKYQTVPPPANPLTAQAASGELLTVKLRYQQPEGTAPSQLMEVPVKDSGLSWEQAGANFRWTAAVAGYALLLRDSKLAGTLDWSLVRTLAAGAKGPDPDGFRGEFLQLVEKAAGLSPSR